MEPPADAVAGGCRVAYSIGDGPERTGLLAHNARDAATGIGVIPVLSLLGATLIGLRVGQTVPMLCEDGTVTRLTVLGVARPA
jgi:transcription elongation GreA/GreB family factor